MVQKQAHAKENNSLQQIDGAAGNAIYANRPPAKGIRNKVDIVPLACEDWVVHNWAYALIKRVYV